MFIHHKQKTLKTFSQKKEKTNPFVKYIINSAL